MMVHPRPSTSTEHVSVERRQLGNRRMIEMSAPQDVQSIPKDRWQWQAPRETIED